MKYQSLWALNPEEDIRKLEKDLDVDVLIIGGGITGLTTLYFLRNSNLKVALVEANTIGSGSSGYTTGKISYVQELVYQKLNKMYDFETAKKYLDSQLAARDMLLDIIKKENIACDLEKVDYYLGARNDKDILKVEKEGQLLKKMGIEVKDIQLGKHSVLVVKDIYVFHIMKYLRALKKIGNKNIYEKTKIIKLQKEDYGYLVESASNKIKAKKVIVTCHYPFFLKPYWMPFKVRCEKSYIAASKSKKQKWSMNTSDGMYSARYQQDYMINLLGSYYISNKLNERENYQVVTKFNKELGLRPDYLWQNDDMMSVDGMPYIGKMEKDNDKLLIATGYNTWGMTNGTLAGYVLSEMVMGRTTDYDRLFDPLRVSFYRHGKELLLNSFLNMQGFIISKIKGKHRCPHMGCSLIYNPVSNTWDCPCHASKFSREGKWVKGPSDKDMDV